MNRVLIAISLSDYKLYSQIIALSALPDLERNEGDILALHLSVQTQDLGQYKALHQWLEDHRSIFTHVYIETWWDTRLTDGAPMNKVIAATRHRNLALDTAVRKGYSHLWFIDSDILVPPHALRRLLSLDVPLASGVYYSRDSRCPGIPFVFRWHYGDAIGAPGDDRGHPLGTHFIRTLPLDGEMEADFTGAGCMMIRRDLFTVQRFRHEPQDGDICSLAEDGYYCWDYYRRTGRRIVVALDIHCGHVGPDLTVYGPQYCPSYRRHDAHVGPHLAIYP